MRGPPFEFPATLHGTTPRFRVYCQTTLGSLGADVATRLLTTCEGDLDKVRQYFPGVALPVLPLSFIGGYALGDAYHEGCSGTDIYCDIRSASSGDLERTRMLLCAEIVELFCAAQGGAWTCDASNGEALSRTLATGMFPAGAPLRSSTGDATLRLPVPLPSSTEFHVSRRTPLLPCVRWNRRGRTLGAFAHADGRLTAARLANW
jgi:hypothetical protein